MTPRQSNLVQDSFALLAKRRHEASELFYMRLFFLDPSLRAMFHVDFDEQGRKLMTVLAAVVGWIDNLDQIAPSIGDLARRHVDYGVRDDHYPVVGKALLWTFDKLLGDAFDVETQEAWTVAYAQVSRIMIDAAADASPSSVAIRAGSTR